MSNQLNAKTIAQHFNRSAKTYDQYAVIAHETIQRLLERLNLIRLQPQHIIDLGCGTGRLTRQLKKCYPKSIVTGIDLTEGMITIAKKNKSWFSRERFIQASAEHIPLATQSIDLIISNQLLHWCQPLENVIKECKRVLKPGGLFFFTCLGPDTLKELRQSWAQVDQYKHVHQFTDMHDIGDLLVHSGFSDPVMDMEYFILTYPNAHAVMQDIKRSGASNALLGQDKGLTTHNKVQTCLKAYEQYRNEEGLYPATYEVIYGHAWVPLLLPLTRPNTIGEIRISLDQIRKS